MNSGSEQFRYLIDEFADIKVMRHDVPDWDRLSLRQKEFVYHLCQAALWGRDIIYDQNCAVNLPLRKTLENILERYSGDRSCTEFHQFETYAKRFFFANGIHHHYSEDKILPECPEEYFSELLTGAGEVAQERAERLLEAIYRPELLPQRRCTATDGRDIVAASAVGFYEGVTRDEVEAYYASQKDAQPERPLSHGLNSKLIKEGGVVREEKWRVGGLYSPAIEKICEELGKAAAAAENERQKKCIDLLIEYYRTGDLKTWDEYNVEWVQYSDCDIDFINGFIEDYNDPLGRKGAWESYVLLTDREASQRTERLSANAQWFEDNSPVDARFKKKEVKGVSARVVNVVCRCGDAYPACAIGINLPNADWIRKEYGSKSVTITNITRAYDLAALESPSSVLEEFAYGESEKELCKKWGSIADEIHTDLHECLGHGSGQLLPGVSSSAMGEYSSTLEEARADLFGLYYAADPKLVELGIMPSPEAYKAEYSKYIRNALLVQLARIESGKQVTEAHMQNRKLIAQWCLENGDGAIEKVVDKGKTYFVVRDYETLRVLFGKLLAEVQRIKSEGDYAAGKALVERYGIEIDPAIHEEVLQRYRALGLKPYGGFINPSIEPVLNQEGEICDYILKDEHNYLEQVLKYGKEYATL